MVPYDHQDESYRGPLLGAYLRLAHRSLLGEITRRFEEAGFGDLGMPHFAVMQALYERPTGMRGTELAAYARITKQAVKETVDYLVTQGYVTRIPDPTDRRASLVVYAERGHDFAQSSRPILRAIESEVENLLGKERLTALRQDLQTLRGAFDRSMPPRESV